MKSLWDRLSTENKAKIKANSKNGTIEGKYIVPQLIKSLQENELISAMPYGLALQLDLILLNNTMSVDYLNMIKLFEND